MLPQHQLNVTILNHWVFLNYNFSKEQCMLPADYRMIETCRSVFKCFDLNFRSLNEYMCIYWCINYINYRMHGATIKIRCLSFVHRP